MTPLERTQSDWPSLLSEARGWPALASFAGSSDEELSLLLQAPVAVAWWITTFARELADASRLEIVIVCAPGGPASADDGRPYQLVPLLLDRPALKVVVHLVFGEPGSVPVASVPHARPSISLRRHDNARRAPAMVFSGTLAEWWELNAASPPDLCLLFHPAFDEDVDFWRGLAPILAAGVPVGSFGRGREKLARDAWLLAAYGYDFFFTPRGVANPWAMRRPESLGHGAWGAMGWQVRPDALPPPGFTINRARIDRAREVQQFMQHEFQVWNPYEFVGRAQTAEGDTSADAERFVGLPDHYAVSLRTGEVWSVEADAMVPAGGIRLPPSVLATYPGANAHSFEQLLWAVDTYLHEFRPLEASLMRAAHEVEVHDLKAAAEIYGRATPEEIAAITHYYAGGGSPTPATPGSEPLFAALSRHEWNTAAGWIASNPRLLRAQDEDGRTPLFYAMAGRQYEVARRWLEAGADPDHLDHEGFAVLHDVVKRDVAEPVELLHRHGADLDLETGLGFTPSLISLRYGTWSVLAYLIAQGVDLNKTMIAGASVAEQYTEVKALPRVLRREIERRLGRRPVIPIVARGAAEQARPAP